MNGAQPNYYDTLGMSPSATPEEIKRRYRELARRYHPDVNPSPEAAQKIKAINEAYHVLGDADRRSLYDAERFLRQQSAPRAAQQSGPAGAPFAAGRAGFNGFGRTVPDPPNASGPQRAAGAEGAARAAGSDRTAVRAQIERLLAEAHLAFVNRRYREAETFCISILALDRRNDAAHEIMGDINMKRGRVDSATIAYSYAVQFNPRNMSAQTKLERLIGGSNRGHTGPIITSQPTTPLWQQFAEGPRRDRGIAVLSVLLGTMFLGMLALVALLPGISLLPFVPWLKELSLNLFIALAFNGVIAGILLAFYGGMRPISEELLTRRALPDDRDSPVSLGMLLTAFAVVWFYASLLVYVGIAFAKNRVSLSVLRVYGVTLFLTALFAAMNRPIGANSTLQALAFAGNLLFPCVLFGWAVGDAIRLPGR
jgi:curved DNA-binding protein CbpA